MIILKTNLTCSNFIIIIITIIIIIGNLNQFITIIKMENCFKIVEEKYLDFDQLSYYTIIINFNYFLIKDYFINNNLSTIIIELEFVFVNQLVITFVKTIIIAEAKIIVIADTQSIINFIIIVATTITVKAKFIKVIIVAKETDYFDFNSNNLDSIIIEYYC